MQRLEFNVVKVPRDHAESAFMEEAWTDASSLSYKTIIETLDLNWNFEPYPRCTRAQLEQIEYFLVAAPCKNNSKTNEMREASSGESRLKRPRGEAQSENLAQIKKDDKEVLPSFYGVVGLVWVPLSASNNVEGYVQVVLVHPVYRRRGVAKALLRTCLDMTHITDLMGASVRTRAIARWRLHTMHWGIETSIQRTAFAADPTQSTEKFQEDAKEEAGKEEEMARQREESAATRRMYEQMGFVERRLLGNYYAGCIDGVELVKAVPPKKK